MMIYVPSGFTTSSNELISFARQQVLKKLRGTLKKMLNPLLIQSQSSDPVLFEKNTAAYGGALYGISYNTKRSAFLRHPNFSRKIKGMYFCGGTVHPGGGISFCLKSAKIVGELVMKNGIPKH